MTTATPSSLWRHSAFLKLWGGETASQFGAQLGGLAIPVLAVAVLGATEFDVGLLSAAGTAAFLVVGLPAGAWIDRMLKRRVMLRADLVRSLATLMIPVLFFAGMLEVWHLVVITVIVGIATVFFDVAYQSYIPVLVDRSHISDANSKMETTAQIARIGGPALAGGILTVLQAPFLLAATAVTYFTSFLILTTIRDNEVQAPRDNRKRLVTEIREGAAFVWNEPLLRRIVACTSTSNLFSALALTMMPILVLRELGLSPAVLGIATGVGAVGGLIGASVTAKLTAWIGEGMIIPISAMGVGLAGLVFASMSLASGPAVIGLFIVAEFTMSFSVLVYNIAQVSFRQRICPTPLLGRMNASIRFVVWGVLPIAGVASGALSAAIGAIPVVWIGMIGNVVTAGFVVFSPLWRMRSLPAERTGESSKLSPRG